ncbi:hypothetical protein [Allobranchiibius sp. GilTou38]|uniref:hypothetical protein n=1 Tax=Allobranchiibius sp. GilTou38 TaxID=2815210 RepID=UPI001AA0FD00|nr:hypothetical protein [Allobranchiibius sp. GilTou38]MBO1766592.1 hypothetical protein [Allobranchiibius sp. GilTou38]
MRVEPLFSRRALRFWYRALHLLVLLPVLVAAGNFVLHGFYPVNDDAYTAMSSWDLYTGHWPVQGAHSTSVSIVGVEVHHPGPLFYYVMAPFLLLGKGGIPLVVGEAAISAGCALAALGVARRLGGVAMSSAVAVAWLLTALQVGDGLFARPFNPYPPVLVLPLLLLSTWGVLLERYTMVVPWVLALSLSTQPHLGNVPMAVVLIVLVLGTGFVRWWRRREAPWPLRGWRRENAVHHYREFAAAAGLALLLWLPSLIELFIDRPNNLQQFVRYLGADSTSPPIGLQSSGPFVLDLAGGMQHAHQRALHIAFGDPQSFSAGLLLGVLIAVGVLVVPWLGRELDARRARALAWWALLLDLSLCVFAVGLSRLVPLSLVSYEYVQVPVVWSLASATLVLEVWWYLRLLHASGPARSRAPSWSAWPRGAVLPVLAVLLAASVVVVPHGDDAGTLEIGRRAHQALPVVQRKVQALGGTHASVVLQGDSIGASYDLGWAFGYGFLRKGMHPHIASFGNQREYWDFRKYTTAPADAVRVYIASSAKFPAADVPARTPTALRIAGTGEHRYWVYIFRPTTRVRT